MKEERKITVISLEKIDSLDEIKYSLDDAIKLTGKKSLEECVLKILNFDKKKAQFYEYLVLVENSNFLVKVCTCEEFFFNLL